MVENELYERIQKIQVVLSDVDGVLTNGGIIIDDHGVETKRFDVKDGYGIKLLQRAGLEFVLLTGRMSGVVTHRAAELGITNVFQGASDKKTAYAAFKQQAGYTDEEIAYIGDDVVDLPILKQVGMAIAVQDAANEVKIAAHYVTSRPGGYGAVREVAELLLKTQNRWETLIESYLT